MADEAEGELDLRRASAHIPSPAASSALLSPQHSLGAAATERHASDSAAQRLKEERRAKRRNRWGNAEEVRP